MSDFKKLQGMADTGDAQAINLLRKMETELAAFMTQAEARITARVRTIVGDITKQIAKPNAITDRTGDVVMAVRDLADEWAELVIPAEDVVDVVVEE